MQTSMAMTALVMGVVGGPHCVAMCGAACAGISRAAGQQGARALWTFQVSRMLGYALMGAFAAGSVQGLAWLGTNTSVIRPVWTMFHVAALLLGLALVLRARQPAWIDDLAQGVWRRVRPVLVRLGAKAPVVLGVAWALMPCGLLYSALLMASLSASAPGWCLDHGPVRTGNLRLADGGSLAAPASSRRRFGRVGHSSRRSGAHGHVRLGAVDGHHPAHRTVVPLNQPSA